MAVPMMMMVLARLGRAGCYGQRGESGCGESELGGNSLGNLREASGKRILGQTGFPS